LKNILITGCGGDIAQGIAKILRLENPDYNLIGCDIHNDHPAEKFFNSCEIVPRADGKDYFDCIRNVLANHHVELIIPISEAEISSFINNGNMSELNDVPVLLANEKAIRIGLNKIKTANFLRNNSLCYPWTKLVSEGNPPETPCILKMISGQGSKNLTIVKDHDLVEYYKKTYPNYIWQELLMPNDQEYTCGLYRTSSGEIRTICFNRKLQGGLTGSGVVVDNENINEYLYKIAEAIDLKGSINVQLRLTDKGPVAFEINPRFSSTVVFRYLLGFQDLVWAIQELLGNEPDTYKEVQSGIRIYRGSNEIII